MALLGGRPRGTGKEKRRICETFWPRHIVSEILLLEAGVQIPIVRAFDAGQFEPEYIFLFG
jgi:hypothetical protein